MSDFDANRETRPIEDHALSYRDDDLAAAILRRRIWSIDRNVTCPTAASVHVHVRDLVPDGLKRIQFPSLSVSNDARLKYHITHSISLTRGQAEYSLRLTLNMASFNTVFIVSSVRLRTEIVPSNSIC